MQALANVFDTNHNGKLDAGDERFASFKIQVSNADGTQTVKTLAQAGVSSIDLTVDKTVKTFTDGSSIDGQSSFTRTNGTRGTAASTTFSYEAAAHQVDAKSILNPDGSTSIYSKAFDTDGDLASEIISTSSADGLSKTIRFDHDGDGVIDNVQNSVTVIHSDGAQTNTLSEQSASAVLLSHATKYISADGKIKLSLYDSDGNGTIDQREIDTTHDDASRSITATRLDSDGSISESVVHVVSADGQIGTTQADFDGDGIDDLIRVDWTVINEDGSRTQTITDTDAAGSLLNQSVRTFGADGKSQIFMTDLDGDNVYERTQISTISSDDHGTTTIQTNLNADGSVSYTRITNIAADGSTTISVQDPSGSESAHTRIGDTGANTLVGNDGIEILNGGDGPDILSGRAGADTFVFSTRLGTSNIDHLDDFSITDDTIQLGRNVFGGLGLGRLDETAFKELSAGAVDATDRIIYDKRTGDLFYDADGSGTVSTALQFAIVDNKAHLTAADFFV
jgi:Ca2+-binding RTX toxin-like protein